MNWGNKFHNIFVRTRILLADRELRKRRVIFCINSGRSGSEYLAKLLNTAPELVAFHEANPNMSGSYQELVNRYPLDRTRKKRRQKLLFIKRDLLKMSKHQIYCDTNQQFIKTFHDIIIAYFHNVDVIVLRRDLAAVLKSFIELGFYSAPQHTATNNWMLSPESPNAILALAKKPRDLDRYDRVIAYLFEIEAKAELFIKRSKDIKIHEVDLESLNEPSFVEHLFNDLGITCTAETNQLLGKRINARQKLKSESSLSTDLAYCHKRIVEYHHLMKLKGLTIPERVEEYVQSNLLCQS